MIEASASQGGVAGRRKVAYAKALKKTGRTNVGRPCIEDTILHEMGHMLDDRIFRQVLPKNSEQRAISMEQYAENISAYATSDGAEYIAESFVCWVKGETDQVDPLILGIFEEARRGKNHNI